MHVLAADHLNYWRIIDVTEYKILAMYEVKMGDPVCGAKIDLKVT